jgi:hypothetical protein
MRNSDSAENQILEILKEEGVPLAEVVRKHGISRAHVLTWKSTFACALSR